MKLTSEAARQLKDDFNRDGFVAIKGFLNTEQLDSLRAHLDRYIEEVVPQLPKEDVFYEQKGDTSTLKQLIRMSGHDAFFRSMAEEGEFRDLAEILLGRPAVPQNMQFFNKPAGIGAPTPPHQDGYYWKITPCEGLTMWLALEKVDEANGCVRYAKGSHRHGMRPHGQTKTLGFSQGITDFPSPDDQANETITHAQPGDLLVHDALTVHWANGNTSPTRSRKAMGLIYYSDRAKTDTAARDNYQKALHEQLAKSGKI